jgi:hypothetical protein
MLNLLNVRFFGHLAAKPNMGLVFHIPAKDSHDYEITPRWRQTLAQKRI